MTDLGTQPSTVANPVLPGFHPDPSILRVDGYYYIATSTFEWFPGIRLHRSRDLARWEPIGFALTDPDRLPLRGVPDSGGVWAPSLSRHGGRFWLTYAVVHTTRGAFRDLDVFVTTAESIDGPWSEPIHAGSGGFDPSLFHDEDGRHWLVNMSWDARPDRASFAGIVLQEFDAERGGLVGPRRLVFARDELVEGPNIYRRDGWYYLMLAQGGTGWNHGILMTRSRELTGPYEADPAGSLLTSRDDLAVRLQKAGHGELVETPDGRWYLVHLASRPVPTPRGRRSILGRETCIQQVEWTADGWLRLAQGGHWPADRFTPPRLSADDPAAGARDEDTTGPIDVRRDDFAGPRLSQHWQSLREPIAEDWASLRERPGWLRLRGRHSLQSRFGQSLLAQRLTCTRAKVSTRVHCTPEQPGQRAGLVCWYNVTGYYYLAIAHDEAGRHLVLCACDGEAYTEQRVDLDVSAWPQVHLSAVFEDAVLAFSVSPDGSAWLRVGPVLDAGILSDDHGPVLRFTGAFVGVAAQDPLTASWTADFAYFRMETESGSDC
ncbi:MAG TPA: glycoside hydrolase family 43 protein [Actinospica sp.]|nr:glycoside hydrolase family 43 protein [Actinospica sp.]